MRAHGARLHVGIDAFNLVADRRGMGRLVRQTLRELVTLDEAGVTLIARDHQLAELRREFDLHATTPGELAAAGVQAVWYPWNGLRFASRGPAIVTIHDPFAFMFAHPNPVARLREQLPVRRAIRQADVIFAVSHWTAGELQRRLHVDARRIEVVPNAPDRFWRPTAERPSPGPYMFALGSREPRKNLRMLLHAYAAAFDEHGPRLVVSGELHEADEAILRGMRAAHGRVRADDEALRRWYSGALGVLVPSLAEGFGLPAVEAMACGAAVLASNTTALPETCGGAAMLVEPGVADWSNALQEIARNDELRSRLREAARKRVSSMDPAGPAKALLACVRRLTSSAQ